MLLRGGRSNVVAVGLLLVAAVCGSIAVAHAGQERYDYDALGRLVRVIDEQGRVTEYTYDAAGNLLQVNTGATAQPPTISSISPNAVRRGQTQQFQVTGSGLNAVTVTNTDPQISVSNLQSTSTQVTFSLTASTTAALGTQQLSFTNSAGTTSASFTVNPVLPKVSVAPVPLAIPPDGAAHNFTISLSNADVFNHTITLSTSDSTVATVSPASLTIPAGQTSAQASITGIKAGNVTFTLASSTLGNILVPVFVTADFRGLNTSFSSVLGVVLQGVQQPGSQQISPLLSPNLGVVVGSFVRGVSPKALAIGTGPTSLVISGAGLNSATAVSISPNDGLTQGTISVSPDGTSVTVPVTVAANAPTTIRRVVVTNSTGQAFPVAAADADRLLLTLPAPQIDSIEPIFGVLGSTVTLTVRGRNLQATQSVNVLPSTGITTGVLFTVSTDGTQMTTGLQIAPNASTGARTVTVTTLGGTSDATAGPNNTFNVVNQINTIFSPITSPVLGVVKQDATVPTQTIGLNSSAVGVSVGSTVTSISPAVGIIGNSLTLTIQGNELQGVTAVQFAPNTGITIGAPAIAADGKSLTVSVTIATDAPQTLRTVQVLAGSSLLPVALPSAVLFRVTAPLPSIDSISPNFLQLGTAPVTLTIRGKNFQNAQQALVLPSDGMTISVPPVVSADAASITVNISAAANATPGQRAVVIVTPAGQSSSDLTPANTLTLANNIVANFTPIASNLLGVVLQGSPPPPTSTPIGPIASPILGVLLQSNAGPISTTTFLTATNVGVAVGPTATGIQPNGFVPGSSGTLTVSGFALDSVTGITLNPATGVTIGSPLQISTDGTQVSVPITIDSNAPATVREVRVNNASGAIPFSDARANRLAISSGVPRIDSITPIQATQGTTVTMTIRGANFTGATAVTATPGSGITIGSPPVVDSTGTIITVGVAVALNAPLGSSVIQVFVPGAASTAVAAPANTFTVFSQ